MQVKTERRRHSLLLILIVAAAAFASSCGGGVAAAPGSNTNSADLLLNTNSLDFGNVNVGSSKALSITLSNSSAPGGPSITISQIAVTGSGFSTVPPNLPLAIAAGQSSTLTITFAPKASGNATGNLSITIEGSSQPATVPLTGTGAGAGQLAISPSSLSFGSVSVGSSKSLSLSLTNSAPTGSQSISISQITLTGAAFSAVLPNLPLVLTAGQSSSVSVTFAPKAGGAASGNTSVTVSGSQPVSVAMSGTGVAAGQLAVNPTSLSFGNVSVGSSKSLSLVLTNSAPTGSQNISIPQVTLTGAAFSTVLPNLPLVLTPGQSFTLSVSFAPTGAGGATGNISISVTGGQPVTVGMSGTGIAAGQLSVSPSTLNFGNVNVGNSLNMTGTLTAGGSSVTVSSASWNGSGYSVSGISFPVTIASGQSTTFTVTFAPQAAGLATGGVSFVSNASNSPTAQSFTGTGAQPTQHSVSLTWNASQSQVVGYYVYRSTQSGAYTSPLNNTPQAALAYSDTSVQSGQKYYYVVTAVDSNSQESTYSNETTAVIP